MAMTPAERQQARRDRKKASGLVKIELWVSPKDAKTLQVKFGSNSGQ